MLAIGVGLFALFSLAAIAAGPIMSRVEQPPYTLARAEGDIELRTYGQMIAAEVEVRGEQKAAIGQGFSLIAAYIFGANQPNAKIAMTAPVQSQSKQTIAVTAPVIQQGMGSTDGMTWSVRFIMPQNWTLDALPQPKDNRVRLVPVQAKTMAVIRFSGTATDVVLAHKTKALQRFMTDQKLQATGTPILAFYNPPWTLPIFRRNEIMLELAASGTRG